MHKKVLTLFAFIFLCSHLFSQDWNEIYYLEGEAQYLVEEREYDKAIDVYRRIIREIPNNSYAKYKIGVLYLQTDDQKSEAISYLEEASQDIALDFDEKSLREIRTPVDVLLYLGEAYQIANRIDEAIVVYNNLKGLIKPTNELTPTVNHRLEACNNAQEAISDPARVKKENLGEPLNDDDPNFGAVFSGDGNTVIFTSYNKNYLDNYYSVKENGVWSTPKRISEKLSSKFYLRTASLSYDGNTLFLATDEPEKNDLYVCYKDGRNWTEADKLHKNINDRKSNETHACVTRDGNTLYFTSDRDGGQGGFDIYKSTKDEKGRWDDPVNLGTNINTSFDEATPFLTLDDQYLFFSSKGHNSIGGFDIFYVDLMSNSEPVRLAYPANTPGDDLFFVPDNSLTAGYTSMYDSTSVGKRDIYYLEILEKINLAGNILDPEGNVISNAEIDVSILEANSNNIIETLNTQSGKFDVEVNPGDYTLVISNENYETLTDEINIPSDYSESRYTYEATLDAIEIEQEELVTEAVKDTTAANEVAENNTTTEIKEQATEEKSEPEQEEVRYAPKISTAIAGEKNYSVQLMALKNPVKVDYFKDVDQVVLTKYPDGFYRYTVGNTESYQEAKQLKNQIHKLGYTDAFIRINDLSRSTYTIQIMALIIPVQPEYFKDLNSVVVTKGADDYFRYTIGDYDSYEEANKALDTIKALGYKQAFVKKTNN